jgi:hypothetical protein
MKKALLLIVPLIFLVGCASGSSYYESVNKANETASKIELAKAQAEVERVRALQEIAQNGGPTAQTAAVMSLTFAGQQNSNSDNPSVTMPQQPKTPNDYALEWAQVLVPGAASIYSMNKQAEVSMNANDNNKDISMNANDNNKDISIHRNRTMLGFGQLNAGNEATIVGNGNDRVLTPRNPADEAIVGDDDDVLLLPQ